MGSESVSARLRRAEERLKKGKIPTILTPLPGLEALLDKYGVAYSKVYWPNPNMSMKENSRARMRFMSKKKYEQQRKRIGIYNPQSDKDKAAVEKSKLLIAKELKNMLTSG